ncbi:expressed unknown protein [Seminavis robusta]|uniref:Cytochrome P450 n=1 Tax=Seminavis robusta TaxID=568900 RepID=A0A9N8HJ60_9STRA|nr:expressed unknown protein [Seminavis robusta]|eukprot:Sro835_g208920.1 n/a (206) ;mRNA; r:44924-45541
MADAAPEGTLGHILLNECPSLPERIRYENCSFFSEAITPCFASFWTISMICVAGRTDTSMQNKAAEDATYREQCIKEALRMYPPAPLIWARGATETHHFENPLFDPDVKPSSFFAPLFGSCDIRTKEYIKIKKGTKVMMFPSIFHHDDRFWRRPEEYVPSRWNEDAHVLDGPRIVKRKTVRRCTSGNRVLDLGGAEIIGDQGQKR